MASKAILALTVGVLVICGCSKPSPAPTVAASATPAGGGGNAVTPDVGAVTPVTHTSLDDVSGGGVNSAAMKKAKGIAAEGVGSVNSAEKHGETVDDGG